MTDSEKNLQTQHPESLNHVQIEQFSGPLDLLLQLIKDQEKDIFSIDICKITHSYVEYIKSIPQPNLENAGDFIRMAAMLMYIKSKTLLPKEDIDEEENSTLKKDLVRLLINYQKYQAAGGLLYNRSLLNRDCWKTGHNLNIKTISTDEVEIDREKASFLLIQSYDKILKSLNVKKPHKPKEKLPSLLDRVKDLTDFFIQGVKTTFSELAGVKRYKYSNLLTFLSLLELSKLGYVSISQKFLWADIDVKINKNISEKDFVLLNNEEKDWISEGSGSEESEEEN